MQDLGFPRPYPGQAQTARHRQAAPAPPRGGPALLMTHPWPARQPSLTCRRAPMGPYLLERPPLRPSLPFHPYQCLDPLQVSCPSSCVQPCSVQAPAAEAATVLLALLVGAAQLPSTPITPNVPSCTSHSQWQPHIATQACLLPLLNHLIIGLVQLHFPTSILTCLHSAYACSRCVHKHLPLCAAESHLAVL